MHDPNSGRRASGGRRREGKGKAERERRRTSAEDNNVVLLGDLVHGESSVCVLK